MMTGKLEAIGLEADLREYTARLLERLPGAARGVYLRDSIAGDDVRVLDVAETVLYHFDVGNQRATAAALGVSWGELRLILVGYVLGFFQGRWEGAR